MSDAPTTTTTDVLEGIDLSGRTVLVTGATTGIGKETARALASVGASVVITARSDDKGSATVAEILAAQPGADVSYEVLELGSLDSVRAFTDRFAAAHSRLDVLIGNAGIMAVPFGRTDDGFELQFGTNHLGHFALTGLLLPALVARPRSRVVTVSSGAHRYGRMNFDDLMGRRKYRSWGAYGQSKLANLLFTAELQRRLDANAIPIHAMAAHPGYAATNLQAVGPELSGRSWLRQPVELMNRIMAQSAAMGALPTLFAATAPGLPGDSYVGPDGFMEQRGHPRLVDRSAAAKNAADARRLWIESERLTGVTYPLEAS